MTDETPDVVSRARAALDGTQPGAWVLLAAALRPAATSDRGRANVDFIAAAPDLVRDLIAEVERLMGVKPDPKHPLEIRHGWLVEAGYEGDVVPGYGMLPDTDALPLLLLSDKPGWPDVGTASKWAEWFAAERDEARAAVDRVRALHVCTHPIRDTIDDPSVYPCDSCGERLPCSTLRALDGEADRA